MDSSGPAGQQRRSSSRTRGFTIVEVVIVVLILGILAAVAVGKYRHMAEDAQIAVIQRTLDVVQQQVDLYYAEHGEFPAKLEASWFRGDKLPHHPQNDGSIPDVHIFTSDDREHPQYKTLDRYGAYWYNPNVGVVRARVPDQGDPEATLRYYNRVNRSSLTSLNQRYD